MSEHNQSALNTDTCEALVGITGDEPFGLGIEPCVVQHFDNWRDSGQSHRAQYILTRRRGGDDFVEAYVYPLLEPNGSPQKPIADSGSADALKSVSMK